MRCRMVGWIVKTWRRNDKGKGKSQDIWKRESGSGDGL